MASSSRSEKRCLYEVLGISKESSLDDIRSSYRRLALQRHPDKLIKVGGISEADATSQFQELVHAYEILFADAGGSKPGGMPGGAVPDLFAFFSTTVYSGYSDTGKGFYKVYFDVFSKVYLNEVNFARTLGLRMDIVREAPLIGNLESPTVMDFCWVDEYDVMAGPNRRMRRKMEEVRKKAKREYNESVRGLAAFVKKRDKRVVDMMVKRNAEMEVKKAEERERKKKMDKERLERAMNYEEPDWAKAQDGEEEGVVEEDDAKKKNEQLYCIVCSKKFKSEKQWKNHEQSKKHKEKVAELRKSFSDVEEESEEEDDEAPETVEEFDEKIQEEFNIHDEWEENDVEEEVVDETDDEYFMAEEDVKGSEDEDEDDEMSLLKKMVSEQKNKRKNVVSRKEDEFVVEIVNDTAEFSESDKQKSTGRNRKGNNTDDNVNATGSASGALDASQKDEEDSMEYDNRKITGRRRRSKKGKYKNNLVGLTEKSSEADFTQDRNGDMEESHSETFEDRRSTSKKTSSNGCDRCGEEFESRTKLFKHVADTGHATVKSR
ncbi:hypothetical protein Bca52824_084326 [Brassica carinata]|uniref:Uncharacterized protein n=1 Tax=Brassica carinata TaxID=52824 RepID=A0A8X7TTL8_BRACI|nr:hypothetical protein Bca52824_084326 [Brassica carinata]